MAAGKPIIASKVGGIPEIIENGTNGALVEPDPKNIANGISSVLQDPQYQSKLTENARERLNEYFTWPRAREQWLALYTKVLDK